MTARWCRRAGTAALFSVIAALAACSDDQAALPGETTVAPAGSVTTTSVVDDGVLRLGVLLPRSGSGAPFGEPLVNAVDLAVAEVNAAGGVNGQPVEIVAADEGDSVATASKAVGDLVEAGVDAVVGPASSKMTLAVLGTLVDQRIFTCSPTATAITLTDFPDDRYFARTIASDRLQAVAMAEVIEGAGVASAAILAPDDAYGRPYAEAVATALGRRGVRVTTTTLYSAADEDHADEVRALLSTSPGAVALIGNSVNGRQLLAVVDELATDGLPVVVNDALRRAPAVDASPPVMAHADVIGTSPRSTPATAWFTAAMASRAGAPSSDADIAFAANAYDCVSLIATAAEAAGENTGFAIASNIRGVSTGGANCGNFATCKEFLDDGRNIDLNGASGPLELDTEGDVTVGLFDRFRFDEAGRDLTVGELQIS